MFYRLSLPGARRVLMDHIAWCRQLAPRWNPMSVVGQHMQQAGATPAEAMAFTLSSAVQNAEDCIARGMDPDEFLPRFTFFFDISLSFFEEIAKFRAGRRIWARLARERLGAKDEKAWRFKFHAQTSGVDLTRQQPLNNIARVTAQAMAGIFGGLQSLHTDAYDEAYATPSEAGARIAVATQNILREEAHLTDVIDPLGGSFYVESLTDQMEEKILAIMKTIDDAGGMYKAVEAGLVQRMIGASAMRFQRRVESGEQVVVGVNKYHADDDAANRPPVERPDARGDAAPPRRVPVAEGGALARRCRQGARRPHARRREQGRQRLRRRRRRRARRPDERGDLHAPAPRPRLRPAARHRLTVSRQPAAATSPTLRLPYASPTGRSRATGARSRAC